MNQKELFKNLTSSAGESPANHSVSQDSKKARRMIDTSGRACLKLLNTKNPLMSLSKMLVASSMWHSMMCVLTWKPKTTPRNRLLFQLAVSKLPIEEIESGSSVKDKKKSESPFWATPNSMDFLPPRDEDACSTNQKKRKGRKRSGNLREQVVHQSMWPTPNAWDSARGPRSKKNLLEKNHQINLITAVKDAETKDPIKMWPTPRAAKGMNMRMTEGLSNLVHKKYLETEVANQHIEVEKKKPGGHLNAEWVEWMMGYGAGYTDLKDEDPQTINDHHGFQDEPNVDRVVHGQEDKENRLKALGNSIVPQIARNIGIAILNDIK